MAPKYRLTYFNFRGKAELIRYLFAHAGVEYEDVRISQEAWPSMKDNTPFGQLPVLEVDGKPLAQSLSIARYVARKHGLAGKDDWESARADAFVDFLEDSTKQLLTSWVEQDEKKKAAMMDQYFKVTLLPYIHGFERQLRENEGSDYLVGKSPTWADFALTATLDMLVNLRPDVLDNSPALKAYYQRIHGLKGIQDWVAKRPVTQF